ncbi:hypothetical protein [Burkholderia cenocepacia]|uniref:hypothetical protein n=1 Tax=Burkholderia cenocepacia TaxID=95486 RepID=UPI001177C079|nr:hypothetical protein [Burkholderia cenocepacia]
MIDKHIESMNGSFGLFFTILSLNDEQYQKLVSSFDGDDFWNSSSLRLVTSMREYKDLYDRLKATDETHEAISKIILEKVEATANLAN